MWEIKKHFREDEKVIYEGTPSWLGYIGYFIFFIFIFFPPLMLIGVWGIMKKLSTKYAITDKRIVSRYGIISEDFKAASFSKLFEFK